MLANGAALGYKETKEGASYTDLAGLKEIPEIGSDPEKVENTTLKDKVKQYEMGIGDPGDMVYKFKYDNSSAESSYRKFREMEASKKPIILRKLIRMERKLSLRHSPL